MEKEKEKEKKESKRKKKEKNNKRKKTRKRKEEEKSEEGIPTVASYCSPPGSQARASLSPGGWTFGKVPLWGTNLSLFLTYISLEVFFLTLFLEAVSVHF